MSSSLPWALLRLIVLVPTLVVWSVGVVFAVRRRATLGQAANLVYAAAALVGVQLFANIASSLAISFGPSSLYWVAGVVGWSSAVVTPAVHALVLLAVFTGRGGGSDRV